jgi:hypothetical protein
MSTMLQDVEAIKQVNIDSEVVVLRLEATKGSR